MNIECGWRYVKVGLVINGLALWLQDARDCHKFMSRIYKTRDWIICLEYLGSFDGSGLNLFRLGKRC